MQYRPITCVWEVTMGCNMRCKHCGSSCKTALPGELSTIEALKLVDDLAKLGLSWVTLSGGEPLTRKDLPQIIQRLNQKGVKANIITNGWELNKKMANILKNSGISTVAISIDGPKEVHDKIRRPQAFERAKSAFKILDELGIYAASITTISKENINNLEELKNDLIGMGVKLWQVQLGLPMGNFKHQNNWLLDPSQMEEILDFCLKTSLEGKIAIHPADCIGYYDSRSNLIAKINKSGSWSGCNAGIRSFGILHNGDILGCTSIRDRSFIEGNILQRNLEDIWNDPKSFSWRRNFSRHNLAGDCSTCRHADECLGGCPNTRLTTKGSVYSENLFCSFNNKIKKFKSKLKSINDENYLNLKAINCLKSGSYQQASLILEKSLSLKDSKNTKILKSIADFLCGNLKKEDFIKLEMNEIATTIEENNLEEIHILKTLKMKTLNREV